MKRRIELTLYTEVDGKTHHVKLLSNDVLNISHVVGILNYINGTRIYDERYTLLTGIRIEVEET